ncbi:hypothetical protein [Helicobacter canis]|uniref:hypothetical protein n=1 Tax=Helicobacter canis TaxID=29419 RepID=UPI0015F07B18|nr:hypothetical protein [Helicobacter canis]
MRIMPFSCHIEPLGEISLSSRALRYATPSVIASRCIGVAIHTRIHFLHLTPIFCHREQAR